MAENEAVIVRNPDDESISPNPNPNPFSSIISKFTQLFNFRFPPPPAPTKVETENKTAGDAVFRGGEVTEVTKTVTVSFPVAPTTDVAPVKLESEEIEQNSSSVVVWQVYAIGGFFILKWMVGRWKERRANKKSSNEDSPSPPPSDEADE